MTIKIRFRPPVDKVAPKKFHFFAKINYTMFPEMAEEFNERDYPPSDIF